jgi:FHA domain/Double zinc ribbon
MTTYTCPAGHQSGDADYCDTCGAPIAGPGAGADQAAAAPAASGLDLGAGAGAGLAGASQVCPNCAAANISTALFCEDCGYDFTTGALPAPLSPLVPPDGLVGPDGGAGPDGLAGPDQGTPAIGVPAGLTPPAGAAPTPAPAASSAPAPPAPPASPGAVPQAGPGPSAGPGTAEWVAELWIDPDWYGSQGADEPCPSPGPPIVVPLTDRSLLIGRQSSSRNIHPQVDCGADSGVSRRHAQLTTDGQRWWVEDLQSANGTFVGTAGGSVPTSSIAPGLRREVAEDERLYVGAWTKIVLRRALPGE